MKKTDEMMGRYIPSEEEMETLEELTGKECLSEEEKRQAMSRAMARIQQMQLEENPQRQDGLSGGVRRRRRGGWRGGRRTALIAACVALLTLGAVSFGAEFLSGGLLNLLGDGERDQEILSNMGTLLDESESHEGYTVTMKQMINDRTSCYMLFDVSRDDGQPLEEGYYGFATNTVRAEGFTGAGWYVEQMEIADGTSDTVTLMLHYDTDVRISGKELMVSFDNFGQDAEGEFQVMAEARWEFAIPVTHEDNTQKFVLNQKISIGDEEIIAYDMYLSPISLMLKTSAFASYEHRELFVELKDGSVIECSGGSYSSRGLLTGATVHFTFEKVVDPQEIQAIYFNGEKLDF